MSITSSTNYPWITIPNLLESQLEGRFRLKGFVKSRKPIDLLDALVGLCSCHTATEIRLNKSAKKSAVGPPRCSACGKTTKLLFSLIIEVCETDPTNFASPGRSVSLSCSGLEAERLLGTSALDLIKSESVRDDVSTKWADLPDSAVQISVFSTSFGSRQFNLVDSQLC